MMPILKHLKDKGVTPIMWDDMMRNWPVEFLKGRTSLVKTLNMEFKKQRWQRQKLMIYLVEGEKKKSFCTCGTLHGAIF